MSVQRISAMFAPEVIQVMSEQERQTAKAYHDEMANKAIEIGRLRALEVQLPNDFKSKEAWLKNALEARRQQCLDQKEAATKAASSQCQ